jgi:hypothetical protein
MGFTLEVVKDKRDTFGTLFMSAGPGPDRTAASSRAEVQVLTATASAQPVQAAKWR